MSVTMMSEQEIIEHNKVVQEWWNSLECNEQWEIYQFLIKFDPKRQKIVRDKADKKFEERFATCPNCGVSYECSDFSSECPHKWIVMKSI